MSDLAVSLHNRLAAKIDEAARAVTEAEAIASDALTTREAAQSEVNEIETLMRPIARRADTRGEAMAAFLRAEREAVQQKLKAAKAHQANAEKHLDLARKALADLRLAESQLSAGQSSGNGGLPSVPSAPHKARHMLLHKQGAQAAILSQGLAHG